MIHKPCPTPLRPNAAVHTLLDYGRGYLTLNINIHFLKPVYQSSREVMAEGKVVSKGRQIATAEGRIFGIDDTLFATGTATCMLFGAPLQDGPSSK